MDNEQLVTRTAAAIETRNPIDLNMEQIKNHLMPAATDSEVKYFLQVCKHTGLDPWSRQIYCIKRRTWDKSINGYRESWMPQTSIDGFRAVADNAGNYAGSDEPIYEIGADGLPIKATVTVYKMVQGQRCGFTGSARWSEYCPVGDKQDQMWRRMPFTMISKCAEALALRKGWSTKLSGLYTKDEMQQAETVNVIPVDPEKKLEVQPTAQGIINADQARRLNDEALLYSAPSEVWREQKTIAAKVIEEKPTEKSPFWTSEWKGKKYLHAKQGKTFTAEFLLSLGMKKSNKANTPFNYSAVYSHELEERLAIASVENSAPPASAMAKTMDDYTNAVIDGARMPQGDNNDIPF